MPTPWPPTSQPRRVTVRTLIFWPHLIAGVTAGVVILIMSVTGVLLTYERQTVAWADRGFRSSRPAGGAVALTPDELLARVRADQPDLAITSMTLSADPAAPVAFAARQQTVYADAYSGRVLGEGSQGVRRFMTRVKAWHRWLALEGESRETARAITGWSNLLFLFIVMSGFYLWFPRKWTWQHIRSIALFNGRLRGKARDFNWHNAFGSWSAVPLFIIVLSALPMSFPWANAAIYRAVGEAPPAPPGGGGAPGGDAARGRQGGRAGGPEGRDGGNAAGEGQRSETNALWAQAVRREADWKTITLRLPASPRAPLAFAIDRGNGGQPQLRSTLTLDRSGAVVSYELFSGQSLGRRLRSLSRFAHTGEVFGVTGQTIAGLASTGASVLVWTGLALAFRRLRSWLKRRTGRSSSVATAA